MTLRHRFFWAALAASALAGCLFLLVVTLVVTPRVARRLVEQDTRIRLLGLAATLPERDQGIKDAYLRRSTTPGWKGVELALRNEAPRDDGSLVVTVPLEGSSLALSCSPPVNFSSVLTVAQPSAARITIALGSFLLFVYALSWALSNFVTRPLKELEEAVTGLAQGRRDISVPLPKEEELAALASSFNAMAEKLKAREEELAASNDRLGRVLEAKERIFANTSHELRTPLTVILGYTQLLRDGLKGTLGVEQTESIAVIERNAQVLLRDVEDLLTLSRLRAGQLPLRVELVDLKDLVDEVLSSLRPLYADQQVELTATWSHEGDFPAQLDYQRGCQILTNLLDNARKYAAGAPVRVHLEPTRIEVRDGGPGLPAELAAELFSEFSRGANSEGVEGAGLGLALARGLARQMGGELELLSQEGGCAFAWTVKSSEPAG